MKKQTKTKTSSWKVNVNESAQQISFSIHNIYIYGHIIWFNIFKYIFNKPTCLKYMFQTNICNATGKKQKLSWSGATANPILTWARLPHKCICSDSTDVRGIPRDPHLSPQARQDRVAGVWRGAMLPWLKQSEARPVRWGWGGEWGSQLLCTPCCCCSTTGWQATGVWRSMMYWHLLGSFTDRKAVSVPHVNMT